MFELSILITILFSILIFYFTLYITLKKEIEDISSSIKNSTKDDLKIKNRKKFLTLLKIVTIFLIIFAILLYFLPDIFIYFQKINLKNYKPNTFYHIGNFFSKLVPFKKGFFSNSNFMFSYITEIVLSLILIVIIIFFFYIICENIALTIISTIVLIFGFIWINNFVSLFLSYCITHCFPFFSILFNLFAYIAIPTIIISLVIELTDHFKHSTTSTEKKDS